MEYFLVLLVFLKFGIIKGQDAGDCDFENGLCGYTTTNNNGGNFEWSLEKSSTPSHQTGPFADHNGDKKKFYIYTESSAPAKPGDTAVLTSPNIVKKGKLCLSFWYNAHGSNMGELSLKINQNGNQQFLWETNGKNEVNWFNKQIDITNDNSFKVIFTSKCGNSFTSDMAIDDIKILPHECPKENVEESTQLVGDIIVPDLCPASSGWCVDQGGQYPRTGVTKLSSVNGNTESAQKECLEKCKANPSAKACMVIWNQGNRGCYSFESDIARGSGHGRHLCWVFSQCTDTVVKKMCPRERGLCVQKNGNDQNSGVSRINRVDGDLESSKLECIKQCGKRADATGCEVIWDQGNRGCYVHTQPIARGNEVIRHMCWVFSKCQDFDESTYITVAPPVQQAEYVPAPIYGVKRIGCYRNSINPFPSSYQMKRNIDKVTFAESIRKCRDYVDSKGEDFEIFGVEDYGRKCFYGSNNDPELDPFKAGKADNCGLETIGGHLSFYIYKSCKDEETCDASWTKKRPNNVDNVASNSCRGRDGFCTNAAGHFASNGVSKINHVDGKTDGAQKQCLEQCRADRNAKACQVIWDQGNRGCYKFTGDVKGASGHDRHMCWILSECN